MHLEANASTRIFCRHRSWVGQRPKCLRIETTVLVKRIEKTCDQKECDQLCFVEDNGNETCSCFRGFRMIDGVCLDVNECTESESPCEFECHNTAGSFRCKCPKGLRLEGNTCVGEFAQYHCRDGFEMHLEANASTRIFCRHRSWVGQRPKCLRIETTVLVKRIEKTCDQKECDQLCFVEDNGNETCSCFRGFRMIDGVCLDVNECTESESPCEFECHNTAGSFRCKCPKGLRLEGNTCVDVNECLLRNGHGPCQDFCHNTHGSWFCSCRPEAKLAEDGQSCEFLDQCTINNGNCSHTCHSLMGTAFCDCPDGWKLGDDAKNCQDINECDETEGEGRVCAYECVNTIGSYQCVENLNSNEPPEDTQILMTTCPVGFTFNSATRECEDVDECREDNGGCHQKCTNTMGSFYCSCQPNFIFADDKITCRALEVGSSATLGVSCPPLFPPRHGYLECSRSGDGRSDTEDVQETTRVTNSPGSVCILRCPGGFRVSGRFSVECNDQGSWSGDQDGVCIKYPAPHLICPPDMLVEVPPGDDAATVEVTPRTDTSVVESLPGWVLAQSGKLRLHVGTINITYIARHPISRISVSCSFSVTVLDGQPPSVTSCPAAQRHMLDDNSSSIPVTWSEPSFADNVNVSDVTRTN
uniref:Uncharacterized protein n=1 Tax=Lutzomyia longipalpis TaxID=7200 RepID=A0A1B0GGR9_LUTLO